MTSTNNHTPSPDTLSPQQTHIPTSISAPSQPESTRTTDTPPVFSRIDTLLKQNRLVLFMKGTSETPMCGFSGMVINILRILGVSEICDVNVLEDPEIRQGIKDYTNWPTIPQLYVDGTFIGGCDIIREMYEDGSLKEAFLASGIIPENKG